MPEAVEVAALGSLDQCRAVATLIDRIWGEERVMTPALLRALAAHGNPVFGAYDGGKLVGAQVAFVGLGEGGPVLHSHITGVAPGTEDRGVGFALKRAQRDWCLARDVGLVTWTFDPLVARNAYFNLVKLGAVAHGFHRDYYGEMADVFNVGDRSDRLEVRWELRSLRVEAAMAGRPAEPQAEGEAVLEDRGGRPRRRGLPGGARLMVQVPSDYHRLRRADPEAGAAWRDAVADALEEVLTAGYRATGFRREGAYLLERV